jgi:uncharacterized membrane protein
MTYSTVPITMRAYRAPLRSIPLHFSAACFTGALITDIAYSQTAEMTWANFSAWLLASGLVFGGLALLAGIIDLFRRRFRFAGGAAWIYVAASLAVFVVSFFNAFIHSRDAWTSVVPMGLTLSIVAFVLMIVAAIFGSITERRIVEGY